MSLVVSEVAASVGTSQTAKAVNVEDLEATGLRVCVGFIWLAMRSCVRLL
jgi:hypothetical protein